MRILAIVAQLLTLGGCTTIRKPSKLAEHYAHRASDQTKVQREAAWANKTGLEKIPLSPLIALVSLAAEQGGVAALSIVLWGIQTESRGGRVCLDRLRAKLR